MYSPWQLPPYKKDSGPQEIEALQTDVMRFMAILGLLLMAIFALVQSLQVGPTDAQAPPEDPPPLPQEEEKLKRQLHQLRQQLLATEERLQQARSQTEHLQQKANLKAQKAEQTLRERERRLALLNRQITQRQHSREELDREIETQQRRLSTLEQELNVAQQQRAAKAAPSKPSKAGFSLRFASDKSLTFLVKTQQVQVYAMTERQTWKWEPGAQNARFRPSDRPNKFYEMDSETVPPRYLRAFKKSVNRIDPTHLTWGVILPEPTQQQIAQLMGRHRGGELIIQKDSSVSVDP